VDRWTGSTGAGPQPCVTAYVTMTSLLASAPANRKPPRVAPMAHRRLLWQFCKKNPEIPEITYIPFHLYKSFPTRSLFFTSRPLISIVFMFDSLSLTFYILDLLVPHIFLFRSLKSFRKPLKLSDIHKLVPEPCFSHNFSILAPFYAFLVSTRSYLRARHF
jgi:hypothetical protein